MCWCITGPITVGYCCDQQAAWTKFANSLMKPKPQLNDCLAVGFKDGSNYGRGESRRSFLKKCSCLKDGQCWPQSVNVYLGGCFMDNTVPFRRNKRGQSPITELQKGCSLPSNVQFATWVRKRSGIQLEMAGQLDRLDAGQGFQVAIAIVWQTTDPMLSPWTSLRDFGPKVKGSKWASAVQDALLALNFHQSLQQPWQLVVPLAAKMGWFTGRDQPLRGPQWAFNKNESHLLSV